MLPATRTLQATGVKLKRNRDYSGDLDPMASVPQKNIKCEHDSDCDSQCESASDQLNPLCTSSEVELSSSSSSEALRIDIQETDLKIKRKRD